MSDLTPEQESSIKQALMQRYQTLIGSLGVSQQEHDNLMLAGQRCLERFWPGAFYRKSFVSPSGERHLWALVSGRMKAALEGRY